MIQLMRKEKQTLQKQNYIHEKSVEMKNINNNDLCNGGYVINIIICLFLFSCLHDDITYWMDFVWNNQKYQNKDPLTKFVLILFWRSGAETEPLGTTLVILGKGLQCPSKQIFLNFHVLFVDISKTTSFFTVDTYIHDLVSFVAISPEIWIFFPFILKPAISVCSYQMLVVTVGSYSQFSMSYCDQQFL